VYGSPDRDLVVIHVDDEPRFSKLVASYLERTDARFDVLTATSPVAGLDALTDHDIDCVVSDYDMPGTNGLEFLEAVRADYPDLPFIFYTGKGSEEVASEAITAGVTDYLQKDANTEHYEVLANRITNVVDQYHANRAAERTQRRLWELAGKTNDVLWMFSAD
jgi:DNA-binding NtrC family response regulator